MLPLLEEEQHDSILIEGGKIISSPDWKFSPAFPFKPWELDVLSLFLRLALLKSRLSESSCSANRQRDQAVSVESSSYKLGQQNCHFGVTFCCWGRDSRWAGEPRYCGLSLALLSEVAITLPGRSQAGLHL